jgi:phosphoribosylglycinamide formyltransferase-1
MLSHLVEVNQSVLRIGVFTSGAGGLLGHLINEMKSDTFLVQVVVTDRACGALRLAEHQSIPTRIINDPAQGSSYIDIFNSFDLDALVFAGYLSVMPTDACLELYGRVINSHPSLLPKFGGRGYFGLRVHEEVLSSGDSRTGCTVHLVSPKVDEGPIVVQRSLEVSIGETSRDLARRVHDLEKELLVEVLVNWPRVDCQA